MFNTSLTKMASELEVRKIGNSFGLILPSELVKEKHLRVRDKVIVEIVKETNLKEIFGTLKRKQGMSGQEMKDLGREGWL